MNWFNYTEQKRTLLAGGTFIICLAVLMVSARRDPYALDAFWHLQTGLDWLTHGLSPWIDHYSFTFNDQKISNQPYLFQLLLAWLVNQFGLEPGFQIYRFASFFAVFSLFVVFLRQLKAPTIIYCLTLPMLAVLLQYRNLVRPELLSYSFCVLAMMLYYRTRNEISTRGVLPIIVLMLIWSNYHSSILGYIIFFGYFVDTGVQQLRDRSPSRVWLTWLGWGVTIVGVGFLHPGFQHPLLGSLTFAPDWKKYIDEYAHYGIFLKHAAFYVLLILTLMTIALLVWKRKIGPLIICVVFIWGSISMIRLVIPGGIIMLCLFAWLLKEKELENLLRNRSGLQQNLVGGLFGIMIVLSLLSAVLSARFFMEENKLSNFRYPKDVADYMLDNQISGRIFNEYDIGGYLIYRLSPDSKVYIDGRTNILYPIEHMHQFFDAITLPASFDQETQKYDIDVAILPNEPQYYALAYESGRMSLDFMGARYSLFRKNEPNFPILGELLVRPACWNQQSIDALEQEKLRAFIILPSYSELTPLAFFVTEFALADDQVAFMENAKFAEGLDDSMIRFAAFQALRLGRFELAHELFANIQKANLRDYLASAMARVGLDDWVEAESIIDRASRIVWQYAERDDLVNMYRILLQIRDHGALEKIDDEYLERLSEQIGNSASIDMSQAPDIHSFCPRLEMAVN